MSKYESLFREILQATRGGNVRWRQVPRDSNSHIVFNADRVFRQFESWLHRHGHQYKLIFVEKKLLDPEQDFSYERYEPEVLVVDGNELVATLSDSVIDRFDLFELARAVEARSDRASRLFGE